MLDLKEAQEYLLNIKNSIFNGTGPTTIKGVSDANLGAMDYILHCFYTCILILLSPQNQTQGLLNGDFTNYCHLCKMMSCDQIV